MKNESHKPPAAWLLNPRQNGIFYYLKIEKSNTSTTVSKLDNYSKQSPQLREMASACKISIRGLTTTSVLLGKKNFKKFLLYNKRGTVDFKKRQAVNPDPDIPIDNRGVKSTGYTVDGKFIPIPEKIPQLIVPDLKNFKLKPYVSYKSTDVTQSKFTAEDLFTAIYADKIRRDFQNNKLKENGEPIEPNQYEKLTSHEAKILADKTASMVSILRSRSL
ncbi:39S ribosomal protein L41, mitochondrial isoform X2 [Venturia canescens]|uniref:39S ribosomal protein L41, mitochondrial isoform X2 n=1 Tax=Venturia canescens TaxID=32260 RepID=UPI001C9D5252|nr:39S ribosomal protein L41, mitochondrial isoform X2 [Venturia canescens]